MRLLYFLLLKKSVAKGSELFIIFISACLKFSCATDKIVFVCRRIQFPRAPILFTILTWTETPFFSTVSCALSLYIFIPARCMYMFNDKLTTNKSNTSFFIIRCDVKGSQHSPTIWTFYVILRNSISVLL